MRPAVKEPNADTETEDVNPSQRTDTAETGTSRGWFTRLHRMVTRLSTRDAPAPPDQRGRGDVDESSGRRATDSTWPRNSVTPDGSRLDFDDVFEVLRNRRRRDVLRRLDAERIQLQLGTVAEEIAARECDTEPSQVTSKQRKRVYIALYQCHLPKMDEVDAIDYDSRGGGIAPGPNFRVFLHYLPADETVTAPAATDT